MDTETYRVMEKIEEMLNEEYEGQVHWCVPREYLRAYLVDGWDVFLYSEEDLWAETDWVVVSRPREGWV